MGYQELSENDTFGDSVTIYLEMEVLSNDILGLQSLHQTKSQTNPHIVISLMLAFDLCRSSDIQG